MEDRQMKKVLGLIMSIALFTGSTLTAEAKSEKKNPPKNTKAVEEALTKAGGDHFPEKMKVSKVGPIEVDDTFYHAFCGSLKKAGYRIILFDNQQNYLGYYLSEFEPADYEEGAVLLDSGESDEDGNPDYYYLRIGSKGPSDKVSIDGIPSLFVKNEAAAAKVAEAKASAVSTASSEPIQPEYREWILINRGKKVPVEAIYVKQGGNKITLKKKSDGRSKDFPLSMLSEADKEYVKTLK
jgi:hypothetical protein